MLKLISKILTFLTVALLIVACANPGSGPDGGPFDETPPRIVHMSPALGGTNEHTKKISIVFDELIKVENVQEKVIISPPQVQTPEFKVAGKRITVQLADSLKENTTYTVDFSDAIVDTNEGNALGNFTYYFSTGAQLDTMQVAGSVLSAENLEPVKGILVGLHSNLADSAFTTLPFDRVARTDGNGHFSIKGVAPGKYRIYALKDMDGDFKYARGEMLAFSREDIVPSAFPDVRRDTLWTDTVRIDTIKSVRFTHYMPDDVLLLAFSEKNNTRQYLKSKREPEKFSIYFTAPSKHIPEVRGLNFDATNAFIVERSVGNDTLTYWLRDTALVNQDTLAIACTYEATNDSTLQSYMQTDTLELVPQFSYAKRQKFAAEDLAKWRKGLEKRHKNGDFSQETPPVKPLAMKCSARMDMKPDQNVHFTLPEPAVRIDTTAFHLYLKVDSTYQQARFKLMGDSLHLLNYTLKAEWRPGQEYVLNIDSAAVQGISGKVNKTFDLKFRINTAEAYGSLFLVVPDAPPMAVVQLLNTSEKLVKQAKVENGRVDFFYLTPNDYYVRLFVDRNENGKWDEGCYADDRQAEEVYYYPQKFSVRANWDIEQTWQVKALPLNEQKPRELIKQKEQEKKTPKSRNAERLRNKQG